MEYNDIKLNALLRGLTVRSPEGKSETAVIENLNSRYPMSNLRPILYVLKEAGVKNIVIDLSRFSLQSRRIGLLFLEGAVSMSSDFETRYIGTTIDEISVEEPHLRGYISQKIAKSLDEAVDSFNG